MFLFVCFALGKPQKKVLLLMAGPLRPYPPPPLELNGRRHFGTLEKKVPKKGFFPLMARPLIPHPPFNAPAIKKRTIFFAASLSR